jgi:predicted phage terminase large subunit-like protein
MIDYGKQIEILGTLARHSLFAFIWKSFDVLHPSDRFVPSWYIDAIAYQLEQVFKGHRKRLVITVPPRYLKSISAAVAFPAWWLGKDPSIKIMVASYGAELATKHARDFRTLVKSDWYKHLFASMRSDPLRDTADELLTTQRGGRKAVSLGGAVTGLGADVLILDDLMKASDAHSPVELERARQFYEQSLFSRLNDKRDGAVIVIQQRLNEDDIAGYLLDKGFFHLNLPAIAPEAQEYPLSFNRIHRRQCDEVLCPEREPLEVLNQIRTEIGPVVFSAQYLQNPVPPEGGQLRWDKFATYDDCPPRSDLLTVVQSWDTAYSSEPIADFSVCMTFGLREDNRWLLLDVWRGRVEYPALKAQVRALGREWIADRIIIEYANAGVSLFSELRRDNAARKYIRYRPRTNKAVRFAAQTAKIEEQRLLRPTEAPWLPALRQELLTFPRGRHDDQADALAQFLDWTSWRGEQRLIDTIRNGWIPPRRDFQRRA